tara:strand:+ start:27327 stop:28256 length:930 start_codon:yes stop_codon:yes gene_type:complete
MQLSEKLSNTVVEDSSFDLEKISKYLISKWKWFMAVGLLFAVIFASISTTLPNKYTSEVLLVDADDGTNGMDGIAGKLGGLAGLAGIGMSSAKEKKLIALQILQSRQFLVNFVKSNKLEVLLFAVESWDQESNEYIFKDDVYSVEKDEWMPMEGANRTNYPTDLEIHTHVKSLINIDIDTTNRVTKVFFTYFNPEKAQEWLGMLLSQLNNRLRMTDIEEKERQIQFLQEQLALEKNTGIRNVFYSLIEEQIKSSTLAKARDEFVFKVIDPAIFPEHKSSPKRALITVLGGLVGGVICFLFFVMRFILKK